MDLKILYTLLRLNCLPTQVNLSPPSWKPSEQEHSNDPGLFTHDSLQPPPLFAHSLTSDKKNFFK